MGLQTISIQLPEEIVQPLQHVATATNQPLEEIVSQTIRSNVPPSLDDLHPDWRGLVSDLPSLSNDALWLLVKAPLPLQHRRRQQHLLRKAQAGTLTNAEQTESARLRAATDQYVTQRSYALALLKWRGQTIPADL